MAWDDEMVLMLRHLLGDIGDTPLYADDRLAEMILVTASLMQGAVSWTRSYTVNIGNSVLSPDPTNPATRDQNFINLTTLKAALQLTISELREMTRQGISIKDGDNSISLQRSPASLKLMKDSYQEQFDAAMYSLNSGEVLSEVIVSPYPLFSNDAHPLDDMGWGYGRQRSTY
jgi:hypothetical protein